MAATNAELSVSTNDRGQGCWAFRCLLELLGEVRKGRGFPVMVVWAASYGTSVKVPFGGEEEEDETWPLFRSLNAIPLLHETKVQYTRRGIRY